MTPRIWIGLVLLGGGGVLSFLNIALCVRFRLDVLNDTVKERYPSGVPIVQSLLLFIAILVLWPQPALAAFATLLLLLDPGGAHVAALVLAWQAIRRTRETLAAP